MVRVRRVLVVLAAFVAVSYLGTIATAQAATSRTGIGIATGTPAAGWIAAEANHLSGRNLTIVCATTDQEWAQTVGDAGLPAAEADQYYGFSLIPEGEMHLSPYVCDGLGLGSQRATRKANELQVRSCW